MMVKFLTFENTDDKIEIWKNLDDDGYLLTISSLDSDNDDGERAIAFSSDEMLDVLEAFATFVRDLEDMVVSDKEDE